MAEEPKYWMTISLNVLNHLGINLYSNVPAVLSEVVSNSWDADAHNVDITIQDSKIIITDDGYGMTVKDMNDKYLNVGYEKRTSKRNVYFNPVYRFDEKTFDIMIDDQGNPLIDEDFTQAYTDFRKWALGQEETLQKLFLHEE